MVFGYSLTTKDNVNIITLKGELIDKNQANELLVEIENNIVNKKNKFVLNLEELKYINSSGLNVMINILTKSRKNDGDVAVCCANKKITELLVITKLNSVFNVCDDNEKAIAILNK
jgi:anti-sigma B factor antagonist